MLKRLGPKNLYLNKEMEDVWVFFKYERLPMFCYRCGIPGHQDRDCQEINKGCFHMNDDGLNLVLGCEL